MAKKRRRRIHSVQDLVWDMADDVKDLVRNEFDSKGKDSDRRSPAGGGRQADQDREEIRRAEEIDQIREAIHALAVRVTALAADQEEAGRVAETGAGRADADRVEG